VAERSGRDRTTVKRYDLKTHRHGNPIYEPLTKEFLEEVLAEGLSIPQIIERIGDGRTSGSVKHWLEKYGFRL